MPDKGDKKKKQPTKGNNPKKANPITMDTDIKMNKPVRGLPNK